MVLFSLVVVAGIATWFSHKLWYWTEAEPSASLIIKANEYLLSLIIKLGKTG